jgi:hypothetical protein
MKILTDDEFTGRARMLLERGEHRWGNTRRNPVTGAMFVHGEDPIDRQIEAAAVALRARDRFAREHPSLPLLPLNYADRERAKRGPDNFRIEHALAHFARSLEAHQYDLDRHPSFEVYMRGLLCCQRLREMYTLIAHLFPPHPLPGLVPDQSYWDRPDRSGYLEALRDAAPTGMPEWPAAWLMSDQRRHANRLHSEWDARQGAHRHG